MVDVLLTDCHSRRTSQPKLSSVCFEGTGRFGVIFFQMYMAGNIIYNKLFLVEYYKLPLFNKRYTIFKVGRVAQSVQRLNTGWTIRVATRFSARPDRPWGPSSLLYNGYRVFPGGKVQPGRAVDHTPPSSAAVMEEYSYTSTHPLGHTGPVTGSLYLFYTTFKRLANKIYSQ